MTLWSEYNFDALVGPTHNYAGLAFGNVASQQNAGSIANPKLAAKQSLHKMLTLMQLGVPQAVLPPQQRPNLRLLADLGYSGDIAHMLRHAQQSSPELLAAVYSAASMWAANMATVSPSCNTADARVHFTPANLNYNLHRAQEAGFSYEILHKIFNDDQCFQVHQPLPGFRDLSDEGAANHSILCSEYGEPGIELFVYGRLGMSQDDDALLRYPARQTKLASTAIAQSHRLRFHNCHFLRQSSAAINAGVFHNDVIFVANKNVIFYHADAFVDWQEVRNEITKFFDGACYFIPVTATDLSLATAVQTYLFNSQLVSLADQSMALVLPTECADSPEVQHVIAMVLAGKNPIQQVEYAPCKQSMRNGGGPACLRLRVMLSEVEQSKMHQGIIMTSDLYQKLDAWVDKHYRDRFSAQDFLDPNLITEVNTALDKLTQILQLGPIYPFQKI